MRRPALFFPLVLIGILIDQLSKWLVFSRLAPSDAVPVIPDVLQIVRAQNRGVAFSLLRDHPAVILVIAAVALVTLTYIYSRNWRTGHWLLLLALGLLLVGAIGNVIDRVLFGYVRDFIDFIPPLPLIGRWAVFNVADICITVGVGCYLIAELFLRREPAPAPQATTIT